MKKLLALLVVIAMAIPTVFAQGGAETKEGEIVEVHFSNISNEGQNHYYWTKTAVENYNKDHTDSVIINDAMPGAVQNQSIMALAASDEMPNMCVDKGSWSQSWGMSGVLYPLNDLLENSVLKEKAVSGAFKEHTVDGTIYAFPWNQGTYGFILYNSEIFAECGYDEFPADIETLMEAFEAIKAHGYIPFAMGDKDLWGADSLSFSGFVNKYTGPAWYDNILKNDGSASFNNPDFIKALTDYQNIALKGYMNNNLASLANPERRVLYSTKKAAMISAGNWECIQISEEAPDVAAVTKIAAWPGPKNGAKAGDSIVRSVAHGIALGAHNTDAENAVIMDFLENYYFTPEWMAYQTENYGSFAAYEHDYDHSKVNDLVSRLMDKPYEGCLNWDSTLPTSVRSVYQRGLQELLLGMITPQELASKMQAEMDTL